MADGQTAQADSIGLPKGTKIGKYEIVERLGMGGQAIVYKGYDALLDRHVAMKQISSHLAADPKFLERFRKEAQILAKLGNEQPAIVTIHELIEAEEGLFIIMEYLAGHSLESSLRDTNGPIEPKATLQILWRLAAALHVVHSEGIIHRDLKPANIVICEGLRAKITDFGVAASVTGQTSMILGTTKYMAPELFEGKRIDGRADLYSLGFIAYEMLIGRPKFNEIFADVVRDRHAEALRWMKWHGNPSVKAPPAHKVNPAVPVPLSKIVAKMMVKDPERRFESMEALGRAIRVAFSPRAKGPGAPAAPAVRRPRPKAARPAAAAAAGLTAEQAEAALVPADEGDELEVSLEGAATAPIPSARLGRKILIYFLLPVLILMVIGGAVGGVWYLMRQRADRQKEAQTASRAYSKAVTTLKEALSKYDRAKFDSAAAAFGDVLKKYGGTVQANKTTVLLPLCQGYLAVEDGQWEEVMAKHNQTTDQIRKLEKRSDLYQWARTAKEYARNLHGHYMATRTFREAMEKAQKAFDMQQFDDARLILRRELLKVSPTPAQEAELGKFRQRMDLTEFRTKLLTQIQQADDLLARSKFLDAEGAYQKAQDMLRGEKAAIMPPDDRKTIGRNVAAKLAELSSNRALSEALAAVDDARTKGDKRLLVVALGKLGKLKGDDAAIKEEIRTLESEMALEQGRQYKAAGKIALARKAFEKSDQLKPNKEAKDELAVLDRSDKRAGLISEGDGHFAAARWAEALPKYEQAAKLEMNDSVATKIVECRFRIKLGEADKLRAEGKYDEAIKAYEEARKAKAAAAALIDARLAAMDADRKYQGFMETGRGALKREQWAKARDSFKEAQKIRSTEEVKEAINETYYHENLARGREAMDQSDFKGALGYFNLAKGFKNTAEVRALIAEVEGKLKQAEASGT